MKLRLAAPSLLVDLRRVPGLRGIEQGERRLAHRRDDAATPTSRSATSSAWSRSPRGSIADQQVRNRGTIGGSLAHGDPASDLPAVLLAAEGSVTVQGSGGEREIAAADLFQDYLTTALAPTR